MTIKRVNVQRPSAPLPPSQTRLVAQGFDAPAFVVPIRPGKIPRKNSELPGRYLMRLRQRQKSFAAADWSKRGRRNSL